MLMPPRKFKASQAVPGAPLRAFRRQASVQFGDYRIKSLVSWITNRQIEAAQLR